MTPLSHQSQGLCVKQRNTYTPVRTLRRPRQRRQTAQLAHLAVSCLLRPLSKAHAAFLRPARWILQSVFASVGGDPCSTIMDLWTVSKLLTSHLLPAAGQVLHHMIWRLSSLKKWNQKTRHSFRGKLSTDKDAGGTAAALPEQRRVTCRKCICLFSSTQLNVSEILKRSACTGTALYGNLQSLKRGN